MNNLYTCICGYTHSPTYVHHFNRMQYIRVYIYPVFTNLEYHHTYFPFRVTSNKLLSPKSSILTIDFIYGPHLI